jgi:hypothetical protein
MRRRPAGYPPPKALQKLCANSRSRIFSGDFHTPLKNPHFSSLFCDFSLRSTLTLAIVPFGPGFSAGKHGVVSSRPASIASEWKEKLGG